MQALSTKQTDTRTTTLKSWRRVAWILMLIADVGLLAWAAMAALAPEHLLGPNAAPILQAGYEGFTGNSWSELAGMSPATIEFMTLVFRMYGIYGAAFSLMGIAVAVTAFRRGDSWAWWALLVGNTITYCFGNEIRLDRARYRTFRVDRIPGPCSSVFCSRCNRSLGTTRDDR